MHPNPHFYTNDRAELVTLIKAHPFALIMSTKNTRVHVAHAPVLIDIAEDDVILRFHLANNNPACEAVLKGGYALVVVTGPHDYISPDWYGRSNIVPTWNYLSAEAEGECRPLNTSETVQLLDDVSDTFEAHLAPKPMWKRAKMDEERFITMQNAITGFALTPKRFEGIRKLSQNKPEDARSNVAKALSEHSPSSEIAQLMAKPK